MPECPYCGEEYSGKVINIHRNWCKKKKEKSKEQEGGAEEQEQPENLNKVTTREAPDIIEDCDNPEKLKYWAKIEEENDSRKTIIQMIENRIEEVEKAGEE